MATRISSNGPSSSTCVVVELQPSAHTSSQTPDNNTSKATTIDELSYANESLPVVAPERETAVAVVAQQWNRPRINLYRVLAAFYGFVVLGMNDASYGALIPYLETYYKITYTLVSLIFLSPFVGYTTAALLNNRIHMRHGQRGIAVLGPVCHILCYVTISLHPPFPVLIVVLTVGGFGAGLLDAGWNAWIGDMARANEIMGFLHGFYGLGATISPVIATTMVAKAGLRWYTFYYVMTGAAVLELIVSATAFWEQNGKKFLLDNPRTTDRSGGRTKEALSNKITWLCAVFLLTYVGAEVALGGWIVTFMIRVRHGSPFASGMTSTGFWLGLTIGRVILGFVTSRLGERLAITLYLFVAMGLELLFWLVPRFYVGAVAVAGVGFFLGPLFPAAIIAATKLLPKHLHVSSIGFAAAFGGAGAALFPFAVGAIAQARGVQVLQPIVLALLVTILGLWLALPRIPKHAHTN